MLAALLLPLAALLEAGGDAVIRRGLHHGGSPSRVALLAGGAAILFAYGVVVNAAPWDFGRLLGVYVAIFFVLAQVLNAVVFGIRPSVSILVGGVLVVLGGIVVAAGRGSAP